MRDIVEPRWNPRHVKVSAQVKIRCDEIRATKSNYGRKSKIPGTHAAEDDGKPELMCVEQSLQRGRGHF